MTIEDRNSLPAASPPKPGTCERHPDSCAPELACLLQAVMGNAECARAGLPELHPAQVYLQEILTSARRAQGLIANAAEQNSQSAGLHLAARSRSPQERHILLVDDEPEVGLVTARMFCELGYSATSFQDPEAALEFLAGDPAAVDLIVTDFCMPRLSGAELIERARALRPDLPAVVTTGFSDALEADHPLVTNTCQVLRKPFDSATLAHTVRGILSGAKRKAKPTLS